jgi:hypothetical protein
MFPILINRQERLWERRKQRAGWFCFVLALIAGISMYLAGAAYAIEPSNTWFWLSWVYCMFGGTTLLIPAGVAYLFCAFRRSQALRPPLYCIEEREMRLGRWIERLGEAFIASLGIVALVATSCLLRYLIGSHANPSLLFAGLCIMASVGIAYLSCVLWKHQVTKLHDRAS